MRLIVFYNGSSFTIVCVWDEPILKHKFLKFYVEWTFRLYQAITCVDYINGNL